MLQRQAEVFYKHNFEIIGYQAQDQLGLRAKCSRLRYAVETLPARSYTWRCLEAHHHSRRIQASSL